jgi:multidrug efflux pump subunit AcrB
MTVDNSIIVIDNITQHRERRRRHITTDSTTKQSGTTEIEILESACISGTNEVFGPLLSSSLTNSSVFLPLIFISGIAGAMFYDQAMGVTIGLLVSLGVSSTLLPVYYRLIYRNPENKKGLAFLKRINLLDFEILYMTGFRFVMRNQVLSFIIIFLLLAGSIPLYRSLDKSRLPVIDRDEFMLAVDWNEHINIGENKRRTLQITSQFQDQLYQSTCMIGQQQFLMDKKSAASSSEALIYMKVKHPSILDSTLLSTKTWIQKNYPQSIIRDREVDNIFNMIFSSEEKPLTARLKAVNDYGPNYVPYLKTILNKLQKTLPNYPIDEIPLSEYTILHTDPARLMLYDVSFEDVYGRLKTAFNENQVFLISDNTNFIPVLLGNKKEDIRSVINGLFIENKNKKMIPVRDLISENKGEDLKVIVAGKEGEYFPVNFDVTDEKADDLSEKVENIIRNDRLFEAGFSGSIYSNRSLMKEIALILIISLALLYFILSSQFESLTLPLLVLLEVPVDIFGAFLALKIGGSGINLMSLIGIVVMSGIVINDSILKVETMNRLYRQGIPLMRAIVEAGHRRLLSILMTTLTAILALLPILFSSGLGADLQKPLALAVIGGMILGTFVSLYFVPLCFYYLKRKNFAGRKIMKNSTFKHGTANISND